MSSDPTHPQPGDLAVDARELAGVVIDLPPGATHGMRREQDGFSDVAQELVANQAEHGDRAGITEADIQRFIKHNTDIARVRKYRAAVDKLAEMLLETEAALDDARHRQISIFVTAIEQRARQRDHDDLLARYQKTREYRSAAAVKAVKTRQRRALARKEAAAATSDRSDKSDPT